MPRFEQFQSPSRRAGWRKLRSFADSGERVRSTHSGSYDSRTDGQCPPNLAPARKTRCFVVILPSNLYRALRWKCRPKSKVFAWFICFCLRRARLQVATNAGIESGLASRGGQGEAGTINSATRRNRRSAKLGKRDGARTFLSQRDGASLTRFSPSGAIA